jgi:hypothetical protein
MPSSVSSVCCGFSSSRSAVGNFKYRRSGAPSSSNNDYLEGKDVSSEVIEALEKRYLSTEHKRQVPGVGIYESVDK